jgi:hypothetical protein
MMDINDFEIHFQNIIATTGCQENNRQKIIGNPQVFKKVASRIIGDPGNQKKRDSSCAVIMVKEFGD